MHIPNFAAALNHERTDRSVLSPIRVSAQNRRINALNCAAPFTIGEFMGITPITAVLAAEPNPDMPSVVDWSSRLEFTRTASRKIREIHMMPLALAGDVAIRCWEARGGTSPDWTTMILAMRRSPRIEDCARQVPSVEELVAVCVALEALIGHPNAPLWPTMMRHCRTLMRGAVRNHKAGKQAA